MTNEKQKRLSTLNIVGIILIVIFLPIIILNFTLVIKGMVKPEEIPMVFNRAPLIVISDSMTNVTTNPVEGTFNEGDLIIIKKINPTELEVGDVITYISNDKEGSIVTHRIVSIYPDGTFETKGDASPGYDPDPIKHEQIQGKFVGRIPHAGSMALFFKSVPGVLVLLGIPLAAIFFIDYLAKNKERKESTSTNEQLAAEVEKLRAQLQETEDGTQTEEVVEETTEQTEVSK